MNNLVVPITELPIEIIIKETKNGHIREKRQISIRDLPEVITRNNSIFQVTGTRGSGKTTSMYYCAACLAEIAQTDKRCPIPLYLCAASWSPGSTLEEWVSTVSSIALRIDKKVVDLWISEQRVAIIVDDVDDVLPEYREAFFGAIGQFHRKFTRALLILVSKHNLINKKTSMIESLIEIGFPRMNRAFIEHIVQGNYPPLAAFRVWYNDNQSASKDITNLYDLIFFAQAVNEMSITTSYLPFAGSSFLSGLFIQGVFRTRKVDTQQQKRLLVLLTSMSKVMRQAQNYSLSFAQLSSPKLLSNRQLREFQRMYYGGRCTLNGGRGRNLKV